MKLIIGYGISGKAAAAFFLRKGIPFLVVDRNPQEGVLLDSPDLSLENVTQVILSPGVPKTHPLVQKASAQNIEVIGEAELGLSHLTNPCIAITGSNGKTTTTSLTAHILTRSGKKARALGNIGESVTSYLLQPLKDEILVIELSSFQLDSLKTPCLDAALILNITPNHLDRYDSLNDYAASKGSIQNLLKNGGKFYLSKEILDAYPSLWKKAPFLYDETARPWNLRGVALQNVQAAFALCTLFGVEEKAFQEGLDTFLKPPHRIEWVANINGVMYYNDSKSSNIHSAIHAVQIFQETIVLIAGGVHKGASYRPWIESFRGKVRKLIAYGQAATLIEKELADELPLIKVEKFEEAVICARLEAKEGEVVLLSPGCSSYDQFRNFEHRGEEFRRLVKGEDR